MRCSRRRQPAVAAGHGAHGHDADVHGRPAAAPGGPALLSDSTTSGLPAGRCRCSSACATAPTCCRSSPSSAACASRRPARVAVGSAKAGASGVWPGPSAPAIRRCSVRTGCSGSRLQRSSKAPPPSVHGVLGLARRQQAGVVEEAAVTSTSRSGCRCGLLPYTCVCVWVAMVGARWLLVRIASGFAPHRSIQLLYGDHHRSAHHRLHPVRPIPMSPPRKGRRPAAAAACADEAGEARPRRR